MIIKRFVSVFKSAGAVGVLRAVVRRMRTPRARCFSTCREIVSGRLGLEIGGPSPIFARGGLVPVYPLVSRVDNCNFSRQTIWEGAISEGDSFTYQRGKPPGTQFIAEGSDLSQIRGESYDFVLSSHMLEHTANPLRALSEWGRVLKPGGGLILIVPHREGTFDHRREVTTMRHLMDDFKNLTEEDDDTHVPEVIRLHDESRDSGVHQISFRERAERNVEFRSIHHHVFNTRLVVDAVAEAGLDVVTIEPLRPYHILVVAQRPKGSASGSQISEDALGIVLRRSPFETDRRPQ